MQAANARRSESAVKINSEDLQRIKWLGWSITAALLLAWAGWVSRTLLSHATNITSIEQRANVEFNLIEQQLTEIKSDVKELLKR